MILFLAIIIIFLLGKKKERNLVEEEYLMKMQILIISIKEIRSSMINYREILENIQQKLNTILKEELLYNFIKFYYRMTNPTLILFS